MMDKLKPCPYCEGEIVIVQQRSRDRWRPVCQGTLPDGSPCKNVPNVCKTREEAIAWSNTRPIEDALRAELAAKDAQLAELQRFIETDTIVILE